MPFRDHLAVDVLVANAYPSDEPSVAIRCCDLDCNFLAEHFFGQRFPGSGTPILAPLRRIYLSQPNLVLLPINKQSERVAVCDAHDFSREYFRMALFGERHQEQSDYQGDLGTHDWEG